MTDAIVARRYAHALFSLGQAGGAKVLLEGEFDAQSLLKLVRELLADEEKLSAMSAAMGALAVPDATDKICGIIMDIANP